MSGVYYAVSTDNKEVSNLDKQRAAPTPKQMKPARELVAMMKKLPKDDRLRVEGIITGLELAQKTAPPTAPAT